jgi:site-specific recombinase XerD
MFIFDSQKFKLSSCFQRYFDYVETNEALAKKSIEKYREISGSLIKITGDISVKKIDDEFITKIKKELLNRATGASRKNHHFVVLRNMLRHLEDIEGLRIYDYRKIKKFKLPNHKIEVCTTSEIKKLLNSIVETCITKLRLKAAIICLFSTGCRVSELLMLNISDIDFQTGIVEIIGKGGKIRKIIFSKEAFVYLKKYLDMRKDSCPALFVSYHTESPKRWQITDFQRALKNQGLRVGLYIHPHKLRRSAATYMFQNNVPLPVVQQFLGHSSPHITERFYLGDSSFADVLRAHKATMDSVLNINEEEGGGEK